MSPIRSIRRRNRRAAAAAGIVAVTAATAIAIPTLAQAEDEAPQAAPATTAAPAPSEAPAVEATPVVAEDPIAAAVKTIEAFTPDEKVAFSYMLMTHEEKIAFQWMVATDEQRAAFLAFITPPPPPVVQRATVPAYQPKAAPKAQVKTNTPAPKANYTPKASGGGAPANGFLACVRNRESRGQYTVVNRSSGAAGAYQFMPQTARNTAMHAGRPDLAGRPVTSWSPADQDAMAAHLYSWQGGSPWAATNGGC